MLYLHYYRMEITPTDFDVIVIGTGITECIIAAACSRIGLSTIKHLILNLECFSLNTSWTMVDNFTHSQSTALIKQCLL